MPKRYSGFTMVELVIVIVILAVLLFMVVFLTVSQNVQAGNTQRHADVNTLLNAVEAYKSHHNGQLPPGIATEPKVIASTQGDNFIDLCKALVPEFVSNLPIDPAKGLVVPVGANCTSPGVRYDTGYQIKRVGNERVTVIAPGAEGGEQIFAAD